ncbi:hypothetical protein TrLO_g14709 [Triparma laevis f. longispina]|uniref:Uncharacterized protein n=1 Tax=Triparma laevis f. longispina TaxID=1714387 RepID=A0A9W7A8R6_9STRA|nr:hypothetical protein TrLO_g14709 [Triparma laevis f. longispina]
MFEKWCTMLSPVLFAGLMTLWAYLGEVFEDETGRAGVLLAYQDIAGVFGFLLFVGYFVVGGRTLTENLSVKTDQTLRNQDIIKLDEEPSQLLFLLFAPPIIHLTAFQNYPQPTSNLVSETLLLFGLQLLLAKVLVRYDKLRTGLNLLQTALPATVVILSGTHRLILANVAEIVTGFGGAPLRSPLPEFFLLLGVIAISTSNYILQSKSLGRYNNEASQLAIIFASFCFSRVAGVSLLLSPLAMLTGLSIALFVTTRHVRFIAIMVVVVCASLHWSLWRRVGFLGFQVQGGLDSYLVPNAWSFSKIAVLSIGLSIMMVGFLYRREGGFGASRQVNVGISMSVYLFLVVILETTLLASNLYPTSMFVLTSGISTLLVLHLYAQNAINKLFLVACLSSTVGKLSELLPAEDDIGGMNFLPAFFLILCTLLAASFVSPKIISETDAARFPRKGKEIPEEMRSLFQVWAGLVLPLGLYFGSENVIRPLVSTIPAFSVGGGVVATGSIVSNLELFFFCLGSWGLAVSVVLHLNLPNKGGSTWKAIASLATFTGYAFALMTSRITQETSIQNPSSKSSTTSNAFAALFAGVAVMLLFSLPSKPETTRPIVPAIPLISLIGGVSFGLYATLTNVLGGGFVFMLVTALSAMTLSGFFIHLLLCLWVQEERHVMASHKRLLVASLFAYAIVGITAEFSAFHRFDGGGSVSVILAIISVGSLLVAFAANKAGFDGRVKNLSAEISYVAALMFCYFMFGIVGVGGSTWSFVGLPASVICTIALSPVLLLLDFGASGGKSAIVAFIGLGLLLPCIYALFLRGIPMGWIFGNGMGEHIHVSHDTLFDAVYGGKVGAGDDVLHVAKDAADLSATAVKKAAALASVGLWTAEGWTGFVVNTIGLLCVIPNLCKILVVNLDEGAYVNVLDIYLGLPALIVPMVVCGSGLPQLRVLGVFVFVTSLMAASDIDNRKATKSYKSF